MIRVKDASVNLSDLHSCLWGALLGTFVPLYAEHGSDVWITSGNDGKHGMTSLHYVGLAVDIRSKNLPSEVEVKIAKRADQYLDRDFDVVLEDRDGPNEHIHIEYQPRRKV